VEAVGGREREREVSKKVTIKPQRKF